jgi:hypothetical protein
MTRRWVCANPLAKTEAALWLVCLLHRAGAAALVSLPPGDAAATLTAAFDDDNLLAAVDERDDRSMLSRRMPQLGAEQVAALEVLCR